DCPSDELLRAADAAMYVAKSRGRGLIEVYDSTLAAQSRDRLDLAIDLRRALEENGLELHYQPIVDLQTGYLLGVEALARWNHPQRGWVSPDLFVSVAEMGGFVRL